MSTRFEPARENMKRLSDADLVRVVGVQSRDFSEGALAVAREEMARCA